MKTHRYIEFNRPERATLARVKPSVRIAFPTDVIDEARRNFEAHGNQRHVPTVAEAKREYLGRHLLAVGAQRDRFSAEQIWGAYDALRELIAVLERQSQVSYWEGELLPVKESGSGVRRGEKGSGVGLIAPGADPCKVLAEARGVQLREAREAEAVLSEACMKVGPRPE